MSRGYDIVNKQSQTILQPEDMRRIAALKEDLVMPAGRFRWAMDWAARDMAFSDARKATGPGELQRPPDQSCNSSPVDSEPPVRSGKTTHHSGISLQASQEGSQ
ncbi:MAG TPA: hypothetical protein VNM47_07370 [Terriglobia bacterium]|nr:hypothetical protein [Terriglobia bacterium]